MNLRAYKYRIYPTPPQEVLLAKTFGCVRVLWNQFVETFNSYHKETNRYRPATCVEAFKKIGGLGMFFYTTDNYGE